MGKTTIKKTVKKITRKPAKRAKYGRLDQKKADKIRKIYAKGKATQMELAKRFGCKQSNISAVVNGYTWLR